MFSRKITLKIILGYTLLLLISSIVIYAIYAEIQKLTTLEESIQLDKRKILKISRILTLMNETESAGKIAIRTDEEEALQFFLDKNYTLQDSIIDFKKNISVKKHLQMLDTVQYLLNLKSENLQELKALQSADSSSTIIRNAIEKLSSLEPTLGYFLLNDKSIAKRKKISETQTTPSNLSKRDASTLVNKYKKLKIPPTLSLGKFDKTIVETLSLLNKVNEETAKYKNEQSQKIQKLWHNDNLMTERLKILLSTFESDILQSSKTLNEERSYAFEKSKLMLLIAGIVATIIVVIFTSIIVRDFLRIQKFRRDLENANIRTRQLLKNREQLISMVSHDLRTPLSAIIGYSELFNKEKITQKSKNYLSHIKYASQYIQKLIDELLDYSKIEAGKVQIQKVPFVIYETINEVAQNVSSIYKEKPIELVIECSESLKKNSFSSDSYRVKQILYNLISNAFKFTDKGKICIKADAQLSENELFEISIAVADTGIGIKPEQQSLIFEEFMQANSQVSKQYGGSGLGLHISQKLAHLLNGKISVESKENVGSTFTFCFAAKKVTKSERKQPICVKPSNEIKIVVIDDDTSILSLIGELLTRKNIKMIPFSSGKEALSAVPQLDFDMIITDIQLPEMNGFHFVTLFKELYKNAETLPPILAITGRKDVPESYYTENGFAGMLSKPFMPEQLYDKLNLFFQDIENEQYSSSPSVVASEYHPETLRQFMGDDTQAIKSLLADFVKNTIDNIGVLKTSLKNGDFDKIRAISHKMLSMFGQIKAQRESEILIHLSSFENEDENHLKEQIERLETLFLEDCKPTIENFY